VKKIKSQGWAPSRPTEFEKLYHRCKSDSKNLGIAIATAVELRNTKIKENVANMQREAVSRGEAHVYSLDFNGFSDTSLGQRRVFNATSMEDHPSSHREIPSVEYYFLTDSVSDTNETKARSRISEFQTAVRNVETDTKMEIEPLFLCSSSHESRTSSKKDAVIDPLFLIENAHATTDQTSPPDSREISSTRTKEAEVEPFFLNEQGEI